MIHSKMTVRISSTGPTKKKMPLQDQSQRCRGQLLADNNVTYTTGYKPEAPPQPISTILNVNVEITKLSFPHQYRRSTGNVIYSPDEAERGWVSETSDVVAGMRDFGG